MTQRMFDGTDDRYHLDVRRNAKYWKILEDMEANNWSVKEPNMAHDMLCYKHKLSPALQHIFLTDFSYLSTADLKIGENLVEGICRHITVPEANCALRRQAYEEALHTRSYQTCVEVLGLDPDEVYTLYQRVPEVRQKIDLAQRYTDLIHRDGVSVRDYLTHLVFYYHGFEGGMFLSDFNPIFSMRRQGLMSGCIEHLIYIRRDEIQHVALGTMIIRDIMAEYPGVLRREDIIPIFQYVVEAEKIYINYLLRDPVAGYLAVDHISHLEWLLDNRLKSLGFAPHFGSKSPFDWLGEIADVRQEVNFFEGRVVEYQSGGIKWDEDEQEGFDFPLM